MKVQLLDGTSAWFGPHYINEISWSYMGEGVSSWVEDGISESEIPFMELYNIASLRRHAHNYKTITLNDITLREMLFLTRTIWRVREKGLVPQERFK